jgi:hypothetical protein
VRGAGEGKDVFKSFLSGCRSAFEIQNAFSASLEVFYRDSPFNNKKTLLSSTVTDSREAEVH